MVAAGNIQVEDGKSGSNRMGREKTTTAEQSITCGSPSLTAVICIAATVCRKIYNTLE